MTVKEKIKTLIFNFGGSTEAFAEYIGVPKPTVQNWKLRNNISKKGKQRIVEHCEGVTLQWLNDEYAPRYFTNLVATCGRMEQEHVSNEEYITVDVPGVKAQAFMRVRGCSMQPTICQGDIIGVNPETSIRNITPGAIYLIVTRDNERMIKHITRITRDTLTLSSDNPDYPPFTISTEAIISIHRVVYFAKHL